MKKILLSFFTIASLFSIGQIENGMVAHFPFNNNLDDISTSTILTSNNGSTFTTDRNGLANFGIELDGSSYVSFNDNSVKTTLPITISVWVNIDSYTNTNVIFTSDNVYENYYGYWMNTTTSGQVAISMAAGLGGQNSSNRISFVTTNSMSAGEWHHIVAIINSSSNMEIYIDCINEPGSYSGTGSTTIGYSTSESRIGSNIGNNFNPSGSFLLGSMDQLVIWNRVLTPSEITEMCNTNNTLNIEPKEQIVSGISNPYPNPTNGIVTLDVNNPSNKHYVKVFDLSGNLILESVVENTGKINLDLTNLTPQVYLIEIGNEHVTEHFRIIKE